jgi:hypothetical protein
MVALLIKCTAKAVIIDGPLSSNIEDMLGINLDLRVIDSVLPPYNQTHALLIFLKTY